MTVRLGAADEVATAEVTQTPPHPRLQRLRDVLARPWLRAALRALVGAVVLLAIAARVGAGPFVHGLLSVDGPTVAAAIALTALATAAAAWRWRLIAGRLGVGLRWSTAVGMYYRSQFVNTVLPGGVVGDVQRAVDHGRRADRLGAAARAVALERVVGQAVQLALAVVVLAVVGMEFEGVLLPVLGVALVVVAVPSRWRRSRAAGCGPRWRTSSTRSGRASARWRCASRPCSRP